MEFRHVVPPAPIASAAPEGLEAAEESVRFDPAVHLQLEPPAYIKTLPGEGEAGGSTRDVEFPVPVTNAQDETVGNFVRTVGNGARVPFSGLAYSSPFRLLSDEGVRALRRVICANEKLARPLPSRAAKAIRGLGYRSKFIHDFNYCEQVLAHLSQMAGTPIGPHGMSMNLSQINFGEVGTGKRVDHWHLDSVPYVMVLLLSDATDMVGGKLQVALLGDPAGTIERICAGGVAASDIAEVSYPGPGHAIFMQGSRIAHAVTPVERAREPRLTLVNSYQSLNPFSCDRTIFTSFNDTDKDAKYEFARHVTWRARGQLDHLMNNARRFKDDNEATIQLLDRAAAELARAGDFVAGRDIDQRPYKDQTKEPQEKHAAAPPSAPRLASRL